MWSLESKHDLSTSLFVGPLFEHVFHFVVAGLKVTVFSVKDFLEAAMGVE